MYSSLLEFAPDLPSSAISVFEDPDELTMVGDSVQKMFIQATYQYISLVMGEDAHQDEVMARALSDRCWEEFNTSYWAWVPDVWRKLYSYAALYCSAAHLNQYLKSHQIDVQALRDALLCCDMGLIMGKPVLDGLLTRLATRCHETLTHHYEDTEREEQHRGDPVQGSHVVGPANDPFHISDGTLGEAHLRTPSDAPPITTPLARLRCPSLETFSREMLGRRAAVLTECVGHWRALRWTLAGLERIAGHRTVPVELGARYTDAGWSQRLMTLGQFVAEHVRRPAAGRPGYLAQYELFDQIPELAADIAAPEYCWLGERQSVHTNVWLGPAGTVSPLHHDPKHNCLVQVFGCKYVQVFAPEEAARLYPHEGALLHNTSRVDAERPDLVRFPLFAEARGWQTVLGPGEVLYMPPGWWHYVRSLSVSCSVSFWFE
ncbi:bifunctional peptidase and arginyl-hydroxylase JMJD5-like isoform X2 [Pollicipes pollicipes]|nr:bifunctional peptidase and arginyl-hydroxylase JMJD5-like isoform X2 [Pollicipes pollicipes]XP_037080930.1 bifunctional peptidase and arginyl-hydroxylase JMJD5-like isoform X2 [Pollicipes pollicipes]XP_037080931.1 bifunctional peptidase and arginyl-hydroxylase JMJD5-like isoform X2 [Pollicipes pollicipes]